MGQYFPIMLGALTGGTALMIDQGMAAMLGSGSVATLSYGGKLVALLLAFSARPLSAAILPFLAELAAANDGPACARPSAAGSLLTVTGRCRSSPVLWLYSEPIVRLLFERGAFTAEDTAMVATDSGPLRAADPVLPRGRDGLAGAECAQPQPLTAMIGITELRRQHRVRLSVHEVARAPRYRSRHFCRLSLLVCGHHVVVRRRLAHMCHGRSHSRS